MCELCVASDGDVCVAGGSGVFSGAPSFAVTFCEAEGCAFGGTGTFGVTGMMGTTGLVTVRVWVEEVVREEEGSTVVDDGVGGSVESASEGTSDVAGVSWSEGAATVELCELIRSSVASVAASIGTARSIACSCSSLSGLVGSSKVFGPVAALTLRRRRGARGGKGASGTEYQGRVGRHAIFLASGVGGAGIEECEPVDGGGVDVLTEVVGVAGDSCT